MDKNYDPQAESQIYQQWLDHKLFTPKLDPDKTPFSIVLPLPNANDPMHIGHAMFVIQDILCRYNHMLGKSVLWLPGADHAGIETQYVFEKRLVEKGKSRFDFDRQTLYKMIWDYVEENRNINKFQLQELGFSLDWSRYHYSLEPEIVEKIFATFRKLHKDNLIYRSNRLVNYCTFCGTAFSDLEVNHTERDDFLYYLDYGPIQIATTRPETIFVDAAVAVNPKDTKLQKLVGQQAVIPLINKAIPIISDNLVKTDFGTGALKITPAHDQTDFEIGQNHSLPVVSCIELSGRMKNAIPEIDGLFPKQARTKTVELLKQSGKLIKTEPLHHTVGVCYRCKNIIEPLPVPQWYVKTEDLAKPVIQSVKDGTTTLFPHRFKKTYLDWMTNIRDWNISRQNVWGPQIPAWYCLDCNPDIKLNFISNGSAISDTYDQIKDRYNFEDIKANLQSISAPVESEYFIEKFTKCPKCGGDHILQETDTFDTWFLSGQWPLTTLGIDVDDPRKSSPDFKYFYPTSVLDTLSDILFFWVGRMMIMGYYLAGNTPFKVVHLHAKVTDANGQKMSKSKGNVINPSLAVKKYGADALRFALVFGVAPASDIALSDKKIESMRNFVNKIWNASRFIFMFAEKHGYSVTGDFKIDKSKLTTEDNQILADLTDLKKQITKNINHYHFGQASENLYSFFWHNFCDRYIESVKNRGVEVTPVLLTILRDCLQLLHPFMPFVTETVYQDLYNSFELPYRFLIDIPWPVSKS